MQQILPDLSSEDAVLLDFGCRLAEEEILAVQCILITGLKYIWEARLAKKVVIKHKMRAEIEAKVTIMRKTRFLSAALKIEEMMQFLI